MNERWNKKKQCINENKLISQQEGQDNLMYVSQYQM